MVLSAWKILELCCSFSCSWHSVSRQRREDWKLEDPLCLNRDDFLVTKFARKNSCTIIFWFLVIYTMFYLDRSTIVLPRCMQLFRLVSSAHSDCSKPGRERTDGHRKCSFIYLLHDAFFLAQFNQAYSLIWTKIKTISKEDLVFSKTR